VVYRDAMQGKAAAQSLWLKSEPRPARKAKSMPVTREVMLADLARIMSTLHGDQPGRGES